MKKVFFVIHTEYHLQEAIRIGCNFFADDGLYKRYIYNISPDDSPRLRGKYNFAESGFYYREVIYKSSLDKYNNHLKKEFDELISLRPNYFVIFNEENIIYSYILPRLKRNGSTIVLAPDGMNIYNQVRTLKFRIINFCLGTKFLRRNKLKGFACFLSKSYGCRKEISVIIAESRGSFSNKYKKKIWDFEQETNEKREEIREITNYVFGFKPEEVRIISHSFLWVDQPIDAIVQEKFDFLKELRQIFPNTVIYVKPHPFSKKSELERCSKELGMVVVDYPYPFELVVQNLKEVSIISIHSTSLLCNNPACRYYWIYPMMPNQAGLKMKSNPTVHVNIISDIHKIAEP